MSFEKYDRSFRWLKKGSWILFENYRTWHKTIPWKGDLSLSKFKHIFSNIFIAALFEQHYLKSNERQVCFERNRGAESERKWNPKICIAQKYNSQRKKITALLSFYGGNLTFINTIDTKFERYLKSANLSAQRKLIAKKDKLEHKERNSDEKGHFVS